MNHELHERTREERLAIRSKILADLTEHFEKRTLSDDKFKRFTTGLHDSDRDYCEKFRLPPSSPDFMTYEALVAEESKLLEMVDIIVEEKKFRDLDKTRNWPKN